MAKQKNLTLVQLEVERQLGLQEWSIIDLIGYELATMCILNIYELNDVCTGFGQDFDSKVSVISSRQRISVIVNRNSSFYKDDYPICQYEDLTSDINEILVVMQAAIDRIQ